jgi:hypothetical protein
MSLAEHTALTVNLLQYAQYTRNTLSIIAKGLEEDKKKFETE